MSRIDASRRQWKASRRDQDSLVGCINNNTPMSCKNSWRFDVENMTLITCRQRDGDSTMPRRDHSPSKGRNLEGLWEALTVISLLGPCSTTPELIICAIRFVAALPVSCSCSRIINLCWSSWIFWIRDSLSASF